jgi:hypothetical protein
VIQQAQTAVLPVQALRETARAPRALITRFVDFWLLGGVSVLLWLVMWMLQDYRSLWAIDSQFKNLPVTAISLSLLINHPHFIISYRLAYTRGTRFVAVHWPQLLAVPTLLLGLLTAAYIGFTAPSASVFPFLPTLAVTLGGWGASTGAITPPQLGDLLFTMLFNVMFFTVGWHYTKQAFGCMMLYAHFDGYHLTTQQRRLVKWNLLGIGWLNLAYGSRHGGELVFSHYRYYAIDLPDVLLPLSACFVTVSFFLVAWSVFHRKYVDDGQLPTINMLVPYLAMYVWWMPFTRQQEFYFLLIPLFHSLQYLAVAGKLEHAQLRNTAGYEVKAAVIVVALIVAGWISFDLMPSALDAWLDTFKSWKIFFFFTGAMLFINIHHYFIDNVIWRSRDPVMKHYLLT